MRPAAMRAVSFCSAIRALLRKMWINLTSAIRLTNIGSRQAVACANEGEMILQPLRTTSGGHFASEKRTFGPAHTRLRETERLDARPHGAQAGARVVN
jgi:hypothetical protein